MKRTTILLPDDLDFKLRQEALRRGCSLADVARQAIEEHLPEKELSFIGLGEGDSDASTRVDEIFLAGLVKKQADRSL